MSCENHDWKAYALGELDRAARQEAEAHAAACPACREEIAAVRLTLDALSTLREEEVPRRIAFVSDKVFEQPWWRRWLTPNLAAACVVAGAILVHAFMQPSESAALSQARIDAAVNKNVAHASQIERMLADYDNRNAEVFKIATKLERQ
jgi:anti-sigma factor RsiW